MSAPSLTKDQRPLRTQDDGAEPLLVVDELSTTFASPKGPIRAVEGVSLELHRGRTLGIV